MPISISELAYGWQITDDLQSLIDAVDFFMINSFPYFAFDAQDGGSETSWKDFVGDIEYYEGIAQGKPLLVTQVRFTIIFVLGQELIFLPLRLAGQVIEIHGRPTVLMSSSLWIRRRRFGICWTTTAATSSR